MSAGLKRGRITARIGKSESHALPASSALADTLNSEAEEKESVLRDLCAKYDSLNRGLKQKTKDVEQVATQLKHLEAEKAALGNLRIALERDSSHLKTSNTRMKQSRRELKENQVKEQDTLRNIIQMLEEKRATLDQKTQKHNDVIRARERHFEESSQLEREKKELQEALGKDGKVAQELEQYLQKVANRVFELQSHLEQVVLDGTKTSSELNKMEERLHQEKTNKKAFGRKLEESLKEIETRKKKQKTSVDSIDFERKLEEKRHETELIEEQWLKTQDELSSQEISLASERARASQMNRTEKRLQTKLQMLRMQPTLPMYKGYTKTQTNPRLPISKEKRSKNKQKVTQEMTPAFSVREHLQKVREDVQKAEQSFMDSNQNGHLETFDKYKEVTDEEKKRKKMIRETEETALNSLRHQKEQLKKVADELKRESDTLERQCSDLKSSCESKRKEKSIFVKKAEEVEKKLFELKIERESQRAKLERMQNLEEEKNSEAISKFLTQKSMLEHELNEGKVDKKKKESQILELTHQLKLISSENNKRLRKNLEEVRLKRENWLSKVESGKEEVKLLEQTLKLAKSANRHVKDELSVVKPYEEEHQEWEKLQKEERQLDHQLSAASMKKAAEQLSLSGSIGFQN